MFIYIYTKAYAVDTQKYLLDETVLLTTKKQMLKLLDKKKNHNITPKLFAYLDGSIPREDSNQAAHLQHMKLCFI